MAVTVAAAYSGPTQSDGRRYARETYSEGGSVVQVLDYLAAAGLDIAAIATARLTSVSNALADKESSDATQVDRAPVLRFQTGSQFLDRLRALYRVSSNLECARLARWIANRVDAGDVTVTQIRTAFGMTLVEWTAFKTKLDNLRDRLNTVEAAAGE